MKKIITINNLLRISIILASVYNLFKEDITRILAGIAVLIATIVVEKINKINYFYNINLFVFNSI